MTGPAWATRIPGFYTVAQAAQVLGIKPSTFRSYAARGDSRIPKPAARLNARTPLWDSAAIDKLARERNDKR